MKIENKIETSSRHAGRFMMGCLVIALLAPGIPLARAASDEKPTVTVSLSQLNTEIQTLREYLSRAMATLEQVKSAANNNEDLSKPFAAFDDAWTRLEGQTAKVRQHGLATKARAKEHWQAWQTELISIENPKLREKAQQHYSSVTGEFEKISERVADAKEEFAPLAADLKDIDTYLKTDLSKDAVSSISSAVWKMGDRAHSVDGKLADLCKQIERTIDKLPLS